MQHRIVGGFCLGDSDIKYFELEAEIAGDAFAVDYPKRRAPLVVIAIAWCEVSSQAA
jgi:hypothetical protein